MKRMGSALLCAALLSAASAANVAPPPPPEAAALPYFPEDAAKRVLDRDFAILMSWFPGRYNNSEQVAFNKELGVAAEVAHERIDHAFVKADLPGIGAHVLYVQQWLDGDPAKIYRQRIYVFSSDYAKNAVRLDIYTPKDVKALEGAHLDPSKLAGLTMDALEPAPEGCAVWWTRQGDHFTGSMVKDACSFESKRTGKTIIINDDLILTWNELWISDQAKDAEGNYVFGNKANVPHKNRKVRDFACWVAALKPDADEKDPKSWSFNRDVMIEDQGGRVWLGPEQGAARKLGLKMRQVVWPYGTNEPSLVLYVYDETNPDRAVSYSWADPNATRVGINLRWMQASCKLKE